MTEKMTATLKLSELAKLSQEELVSLANQALQIKESRRAKRQDIYLKNAHEGQIEGHKDNHRILYIFAPNRMGKSSFGINEFAWSNIGNHPYRKCRVPIKSAIVLQDFENHCKNVIEAKFKEWVDPSQVLKVEKNQAQAMKKIFWKSGSVTDIYSHDQDLKVFESSDYDLVWFDEPPPRRIWTALWRSCTDRGGRMYLTGTPLASPWLYKEYNRVKNGSDPICRALLFKPYSNVKNLGEGNEALGRQRIDEWASQYTDEEKEARVNGGFIQLKGLVFKNWDQSKHLIKQFPIPPHWPIWESIDPHPHKAWAVTWTAIAPNGSKILLRACYFEGVIDDIANQILLARESLLEIKDGLRPKIVKCVIDNAASVPLWSKSHVDPTNRRVSVREELEKYIGPQAGGPRVTVAPKNVSSKIAIFQRWLQPRNRNGVIRPDFYVFSNEDAENFIDEIEGYVWDRKRKIDDNELKDKPVKKDDDILDTIMQVALILGDQDFQSEPEVIKLAAGFETYGIRK